MIHYGFDMRGGDAVPRRPLFREIRETSVVSARIVPKLFDDLFGAPNRWGEAARVLGRSSVDVSAHPRELKKRLPCSTSPQGIAQSRDTALHRVKGIGILKVLLVGDGHDDSLAKEFELHADMEPAELRFHGPGRAALNEMAETAITVRDDTHDSISLHALLQKEAIEETLGPSRIGRDKHETRPKLFIALDSTRRYLELACDQVLSMFYIGVVDTNSQGLGGFGRLDGLSVCSVKSLGLEFPAYSHRVTTNRHVACTHIAETADLKDSGCRAIRHPSAKRGKQIAHLRRCPPRNDFTEREVLAVPVRMVATTAGPIPAPSKPKGNENCLNAFGANILYALRFPTIHARSSAEGVDVRLAPNDLELDSAQRLLTFLESQPDLLRRQVGDWPSNRANVVRDWRVAIRRQLKADPSISLGWPSNAKRPTILPLRPHLRSTPCLLGELTPRTNSVGCDPH
jgi:hypothetical protein